MYAATGVELNPSAKLLPRPVVVRDRGGPSSSIAGHAPSGNVQPTKSWEGCTITSVKFPRRTFLHLAAGAAALPALPYIARAQAYPSRPVRLVVGVGAGGAADLTARLIGQWLSERLGQQFVIETRPGASGNIATEGVVRAPSDGHTLLL